jgi:hypothetical protein
MNRSAIPNITAPMLLTLRRLPATGWLHGFALCEYCGTNDSTVLDSVVAGLVAKRTADGWPGFEVSITGLGQKVLDFASRKAELNFSTPISEELAIIFANEFCHESVEEWLRFESEGLSFEQWQAASGSFDVFLAGLRQHRIELRAIDAALLAYPICFLEALTDIDDAFSIVDLAADYLGDRLNQSELRARLRTECEHLNALLKHLYVQLG